jgi:hypothetical protein
MWVEGNLNMTFVDTGAAGVAILGLVAGFAERLVPKVLRGMADKIGSSAGTPVKPSETTKRSAVRFWLMSGRQRKSLRCATDSSKGWDRAGLAKPAGRE